MVRETRGCRQSDLFKPDYAREAWPRIHHGPPSESLAMFSKLLWVGGKSLPLAVQAAGADRYLRSEWRSLVPPGL